MLVLWQFSKWPGKTDIHISACLQRLWCIQNAEMMQAGEAAGVMKSITIQRLRLNKSLSSVSGGGVEKSDQMLGFALILSSERI